MQEPKVNTQTAAKYPSSPTPCPKIPLSSLSPDRYTNPSLRQLSYTPQKLYQSFMFKQNTSNKRVQQQRRRVRQLQCCNTLHLQKIRQLEIELQTVNRSLQLQIEMYKQMLTDKQNEKLAHIKTLQEQYNTEVTTVIREREEEAKVVQAQNEEMQATITELEARVKELSGHVGDHREEIDGLAKELKKTQVDLSHTTEKLEQTERVMKEEIGWRDREIDGLKTRLEREAADREIEKTKEKDERNREIDRLERTHKEDLDRLENKNANELNEKALEMKAITAAFEAQTRRLQQIMANKDRVNSSIMSDLSKQKQKTLQLTKHFDHQISILNNQKQHLLRQIQISSNQKAHYKVQAEQLLLELNAHVDGSSVVIGGLKNELVVKNSELVRENERLLAVVDKYEQDIYILKGQSRLERQSSVRVEDNIHLVNEVRALKDILLESSIQMENCKKQFIRLNTEKDRLARLNRDLQAQLKQWKDNYYSMKSHA